MNEVIDRVIRLAEKVCTEDEAGDIAWALTKRQEMEGGPHPADRSFLGVFDKNIDGATAGELIAYLPTQLMESTVANLIDGLIREGGLT